MRRILSILTFLFCFSISSQNSYYVSSSLGDNSNSGTSENSPFKTINRAFDNLQPGDTINVMNGLYHNVDYGTASPHATDGSQSTNMNNPPAVIVNKSGTQGNYITLRNLPGHKPKIKYDGRGGILINGPQSYVIIEGFEIEGPGASITYDQAITDRQWKVKADQEDLNYNHSYFASFGIWGGFSQDFLHHHIIVRNNEVHHTTGSGIRFNDSDHITIENNTVYNTTWWTSNASSAIVFAECKAIDSSDNGEDIKMIIRGNTVYNNWNRIPFYMTSGKIPPNGNPPSGTPLIQNTSFNRKIPTYVDIELQGELSNLETPKFEIIFPNTSGSIKSELDYYLNDYEKKQTQAISLISQGYFINSSSSSLVSAQTITNNLFQRASGIIDDLLASDDDKMNLGINYEQGDKLSTSSLLNRDRIGLSLQSEISDKILINGKIGVPVSGTEENVILGNVQIDFLLNNSGSLRAKVFNKENEYQFFGDEIGFTQGFGIFYDVEFDSFSELLSNLKKTKKEK